MLRSIRPTRASKRLQGLLKALPLARGRRGSRRQFAGRLEHAGLAGRSDGHDFPLTGGERWLSLRRGTAFWYVDGQASRGWLPGGGQ